MPFWYIFLSHSHFSLYGEYIFLFVLSKIQSRVTQLLVFGSISQGAILVHFLSHSHFSLYGEYIFLFVLSKIQSRVTQLLVFGSISQGAILVHFFKPQPFQSVRGIRTEMFAEDKDPFFASVSISESECCDAQSSCLCRATTIGLYAVIRKYGSHDPVIEKRRLARGSRLGF